MKIAFIIQNIIKKENCMSIATLNKRIKVHKYNKTSSKGKA